MATIAVRLLSDGLNSEAAFAMDLTAWTDSPPDAYTRETANQWLRAARSVRYALHCVADLLGRGARSFGAPLGPPRLLWKCDECAAVVDRPDAVCYGNLRRRRESDWRVSGLLQMPQSRV